MTTRGFDVLAWSHRFLPSPSDPRQPLVLSDEQARFVVEWYSVDERGEYVYRRGALERGIAFTSERIEYVPCRIRHEAAVTLAEYKVVLSFR